MDTVTWVLIAIAAVFLIYTVIAPAILNVSRFAGRLDLKCPVHGVKGDVVVNSWGTALTSAYGDPRIRVRECSLLTLGERCREECLSELKS